MANEIVDERVMAGLHPRSCCTASPRALRRRQRVAMGRAMAREPRILLFDEPFNLDAPLRVQMRNEIARLHHRLGSTMIYVTHDQVGDDLADKIVVLRDGRIEQVGSPQTLYQQPATRFVAGFIGSPTMNFMPAELLGGNEEVGRVQAPGLGELALPRTPAAKGSAPSCRWACAPSTCGLRPRATTASRSSTSSTWATRSASIRRREGDTLLIHRRRPATGRSARTSSASMPATTCSTPDRALAIATQRHAADRETSPMYMTLTGIGKDYDGVEVSRDIDLSIEDGEFGVFVGLRLRQGRCCVTSAWISREMCLDGERLNETLPQERDIGMVFQSYALYPHMTVAENMAFGLKLAHADKAEIKQRVEAAAHTLQLSPLLDRPKALSGGQRQRVAIGRTLVKQPRVFLFDELLSNLDASLRVEMRVQLAELGRRLGATMVYVTTRSRPGPWRTGSSCSAAVVSPRSARR